MSKRTSHAAAHAEDDDDDGRDINDDVDEQNRINMLSEEEQEKVIEDLSLKEMRSYRMFLLVVEIISWCMIAGVAWFYYLSPYFGDPQYIRWSRKYFLLYFVLALFVLNLISWRSRLTFKDVLDDAKPLRAKGGDGSKKKTEFEAIIREYKETKKWPIFKILLCMFYAVFPVVGGQRFLHVREPVMYLVLEIPMVLFLIHLLADYESRVIMNELMTLRSLKYKSKSV